MRTLALIAVAALAGCSLEPEPPCEDELKAFTFAKMVIRDELRAPSTADFPMLDGVDARSVPTTLPDGRCAFDVRTYVDAQNAFGGTVRADYLLTVTPVPDWEVVRMQRP